MGIAIAGMSPSYKQAPFDNPDWEVWGLPWHEGVWSRYDRLFEMHDLRLLDKRGGQYIDRLKSVDVPLYMQEKYFDNVTQYPFDGVNTDYFNSSIAYMLALAMTETDSIGIFGVDMKAEDEYFYQRPNLEYLIGLADGMGIDVYIPDESPLIKFSGEGIQFLSSYPSYVDRYGWLG